jgi:hypothetical protein
VPLLSIEAMNADLDSNYGTGRAAGTPASHQLVLFYDDPSLADDPLDVELSGGGYARVTIANGAAWAAAANGLKTTVNAVQLPSTTGEWDNAATYFGLYGADGHWWDYGPLSLPLEVTGAGPARWSPHRVLRRRRRHHRGLRSQRCRTT